MGLIRDVRVANNHVALTKEDLRKPLSERHLADLTVELGSARAQRREAVRGRGYTRTLERATKRKRLHRIWAVLMVAGLLALALVVVVNL